MTIFFKSFLILCASIFFFFATPLSYAQGLSAIQRYAILGTSEEGTRIAVMLTHFGPASRAPFATLVVYEVKKDLPIFIDSLGSMDGGETELAALASQLFKKNRSKLKGFGINFVSPKYGDAQYVITTSSKKGLQGAVDVEGYGVKSFRILNSMAKLCGVANTQTDVQLERDKISIAPSKTSECIEGISQLRTIIRTRSTLWFFLLKNFNSFGTPAYLVQIVGLSWL